MKPQYRAKPYDLMDDVYFLQKRTFYFFWIVVGVGKKVEVERKRDELNIID